MLCPYLLISINELLISIISFNDINKYGLNVKTAAHNVNRYGLSGVAWRGVAWRGVAWRGVAWRGAVVG